MIPGLPRVLVLFSVVISRVTWLSAMARHSEIAGEGVVIGGGVSAKVLDLGDSMGLICEISAGIFVGTTRDCVSSELTSGGT